MREPPGKFKRQSVTSPHERNVDDAAAPASARPARPTRADTREALVEAGAQLLSQRPAEALRRLLTAQDIARLAGVHRQTFYRHFPEPDDFVEAVAARLLDPLYQVDALEPILRDLVSHELSGAQELVRHAATVDYRVIVDDPGMGAQMLVWGVVAPWARRRHHGSVAAAEEAPPERTPVEERLSATLENAYADVTALLEPYYEEIAAGWGRRFGSSYTVRDFAITCTALVEGLVVRTLTSPGAVREQLFADVVVALIDHFTEPMAPASQESPGPPPRPDARRARGERSRRAIVEAAAFEFEMRGFEATTLATIARSAGLTEATVFRHFRSKSMLAVHVFARHLPALRDDVEQAQAQGSPLDAIQCFVVRLGQIVRAHPGVADGLLEAVRNATKLGPPTDPDDPRIIAPLPQIVAPVVEAAQAAGEIRADRPAFEVAAMLTNITLLHAFTRSTVAATLAGSELCSLLVDGLAPR